MAVALFALVLPLLLLLSARLLASPEAYSLRAVSKVVSRISRGSASTTSEASEGSGTSGSYYTKPKIFRKKNK